VWSDVDDDDEEAEAVWYPDTSEGCCVGAVDGALCCTGIDAVAIDSLDLTRSRGYVVPEMPTGKSNGALVEVDHRRNDAMYQG
jgi:hypothetical protein